MHQSETTRMLHDKRVLLATAAACAAIATLPSAARAQTPATPMSVGAVGTGTVEPKPTDRSDNDAIRRAVEAARREALPLALSSARRRAVQIGFVSNLTVGATLSVTETQSPYFGPFGSDQGTFGPGRFCGNVPRYRIIRDGNRFVSRKRIGTRRTCRVPSRISVSLTVTYAATPKPQQ